MVKSVNNTSSKCVQCYITELNGSSRWFPDLQVKWECIQHCTCSSILDLLNHFWDGPKVLHKEERGRVLRRSLCHVISSSSYLGHVLKTHASNKGSSVNDNVINLAIL